MITSKKILDSFLRWKVSYYIRKPLNKKCSVNFIPVSIKEKIEYLLNNKEEAISMGARGRAAVLSKYNWESQEKKLIELYELIVS